MKHLRKLTIAVLILCLTLFAGGCSGGSSSDDSSSGGNGTYTHLESDEATAMVESGECILVDCRGEPSYDYEHIPGAINISIESDDADIEAGLPDKNAKILVYCDYGGESKQFAEHLTLDLGYSDVYEFDGLLVWEGDLEGEAH